MFVRVCFFQRAKKIHVDDYIPQASPDERERERERGQGKEMAGERKRKENI